MTVLPVFVKVAQKLYNSDMEIWKDIEGYEGLYQVSNLGNVRSLNRIDSIGRNRKETILSKGYNKLGYAQVQLSKYGNTKTIQIHKLVAQAFLPNPDNLPVINHKDCNPSNNCVDNLEWCTYKYNSNYGMARLLISSRLKNHPNTSKPVLRFTKDGEFIAEYPSLMEIKRICGFNIANIGQCCNGKRKTASGFKWEYKEKAA